MLSGSFDRKLQLENVRIIISAHLPVVLSEAFGGRSYDSVSNSYHTMDSLDAYRPAAV